MADPAAHPAPRLTHQQQACLRGIWRGLQVKEVAVELGLSDRTVEGHLKQARRTLGAPTSIAAARGAAAYFQWLRDDPAEGPTRIPPANLSPLDWSPPDGAPSAAAAKVDHDLALPQRWLAACAIAAAIAVTALVALLALAAALHFLSEQLPGH